MRGRVALMTSVETARARPAYREVEVDVEIRRREAACDGVVTLTLANPTGADLPEWAPGAHIDLMMTPSLVRQYSLCGDTANRAEWQVGVLLDPNSRGGSQFVHDKLHEGTTVRVRGPRNHFPLVGSPRYLFIAGGIGVTPMSPSASASLVRPTSVAGMGITPMMPLEKYEVQVAPVSFLLSGMRAVPSAARS